MQTELLKLIARDQIADFLNIKYNNKIKKQEYCDMLLAAINDDPNLEKKFYRQFEKELAISPFLLEQILGCTKTERKRWEKENKLKVIFHETVHKYGTTMEVPYYDRYQTEKEINLDTIQKWRQENQEKTKRSRQAGIVKAKQTKKKNDDIRNSFILAYKDMQKEWDKTEHPEILKLAYWTMWKNRWAKTNQLKAKHARKDSTKKTYMQKCNIHYHDKEDALKILKSFASISFYEPANPDKIKVHFCEKHYIQNAEKLCYNYAYEIFLRNPEKYMACPKCQTEWYKDYYSLYYIVISCGDYTFSFHTPYDKGQSYLPQKDILPKVKHKEQEGMFRFGRVVNENEMITHTESLVNKEFAKAMEYFSNKN